VLVNPYIRHRRDWRLLLLPVVRRLKRTAAGVGSDLADSPWTELAYDRVPLAAFASLLAFQELVRGELASVRVPLLVFVSEQDHVVPPASAEEVAAGVAGDVELVRLQRAFHVATLDVERERIFEGSAAFARRVTAPA
jgi:carboxylesterase